jgi:hypothetical protein
MIGSDGDIWYRIDVPILGTIVNCERTDDGWRGILPNGGAIEVRSDYPGARAQIPDHHLQVRSCNGDLIGAYLIERRRRRRARRPSRCSDASSCCGV